MTEDKSLNILKSAILLEQRGRAFYRKVAEQAGSAAVREFFDMMADEEARHIQVLEDQFRAYRENGRFAPADLVADASVSVLTRDLREKISAAGFEAAAVSAAMALEEKAIRLYSERAAEADDPDEKALYRWLADWETGHLEALSAIDREVTEKIWGDNQFWPF